MIESIHLFDLQALTFAVIQPVTFESLSLGGNSRLQN